MERTVRTLGWVAACALALTLHARPACAGDGLTAEDHEILAWLDKTGLPTAAGVPWVHVTTGTFESPRDLFEREDPKARRPDVVAGLLLSETDGAWTILPANAFAQEIGKRRLGRTPPDVPIALTMASFADDARQFVAAIAAGTARPTGGFPGGFEAYVGVRAEAVILARVAVALDQTSLAHDLIEAARGVRDEKHPERSLLERLRDDLSTPLFGRVIADFGQPSVARSALADRLRKVLDAFPGGEHEERAKSTLAILETMVAEDDAHVKSARPFDSLSRSEQIDELIFQLRDQNGAQFMQPGSPSIWLDPRKSESPAERLAALGLDAVPALIPAIEDVRWTRTVGYWRDFTFSHYVLTVGDAALDVVERIAGRSFWSGKYTAASMAKDGEAAATRKQVEAWWKEFHEKGDERQLVDELVSGGDHALSALRHLLQQYPSSVPDAVVRAFPAFKDPRDRFFLIQRLMAVEDPRVIELEVAEAKSGPTLDCRVRAAINAHRNGHPEMREVLFKEWDALLRSPPPEAFDLPMGFGLLTSFLCTDAGPEGVALLAQAMPGLAADVAAAALGYFVRDPKDVKPDARPALEDALAGLLGEAFDTGSRTSRGGREVAIRLCDVAGEHLAALLGQREAFDEYAEEPERDKQLISLRDAWRTRRGLPPLVPPSTTAASAPGEVVTATAIGLPAALATRLSAMGGKRLDPAGLRDLVRDAIALPMSGRVCTHLLAKRRATDDGFSVALEVRPLLGDVPEVRWDSELDTRGLRDVPHGLRQVQREPPSDSELDRVRASLDAALAAPPKTAVTVEAAFTRRP